MPSENSLSSQTLTNNSFSLPRLCNACGSPGAFQCLNCSYIWYCSIDCQRHDYHSHSELCRLLAGQPSAASTQLAESPQALPYPSHPRTPYPPPTLLLAQYPTQTRIPDTQCVRVLVLPVDSTHYYEISIELSGYLSPTGTVRWIPNLSRIFGDHISPADEICTKGAGGSLLRFPLHFFFEVPPGAMSSTPALAENNSVYELTEGKARTWKGTIVVLKFNGARRRGYQNIEKSDVWNVKRHLTNG
ncbi:hypothetical protein FS749_001811 [Ceratobasidium sp. UAMH 11750]|nr:hypothetical protein FS749_001811 [Ceratobasidium sp. UAMH 11750]